MVRGARPPRGAGGVVGRAEGEGEQRRFARAGSIRSVAEHVEPIGRSLSAPDHLTSFSFEYFVLKVRVSNRSRPRRVLQPGVLSIQVSVNIFSELSSQPPSRVNAEVIVYCKYNDILNPQFIVAESALDGIVICVFVWCNASVFLLYLCIVL